MEKFQGIAASPGYAVGPVQTVRPRAIVPVRRSLTPGEIPTEIARFREAFSDFLPAPGAP